MSDRILLGIHSLRRGTYGSIASLHNQIRPVRGAVPHGNIERGRRVQTNWPSEIVVGARESRREVPSGLAVAVAEFTLRDSIEGQQLVLRYVGRQQPPFGAPYRSVHFEHDHSVGRIQSNRG